MPVSHPHVTQRNVRNRSREVSSITYLFTNQQKTKDPEENIYYGRFVEESEKGMK